MAEPNVTIRPMTEADLQGAMYVRKYAMEGLIRSEGRVPWDWRPAVDWAQRHILATDPGGCWVADAGGLTVGVSQGFVRGNIWFLAQLFVHPELQTSGIGSELLRRAQEYGREHACDVFSVVSSTSPVAQSLYMRAGMFAFAIGYSVAGPVESLLDLPKATAGGEVTAGCGPWLDEIVVLDADVFGAERRQDHALYTGRGPGMPAAESFALTRGGRFQGYAYASEPGFVAPVAAYEPGDQLPLVRAAAAWLHAREVADASIYVISHNQVLMGALLSRGWRVRGWSFLKANRPFGKFDRYHPAGGILL